MLLKIFDKAICDVLVVGSGGAGLRAAIEARETGADVVLVSKSRVGYGNNTFRSKSYIAAAGNSSDTHDSPETYIRDSVIGGRFINDQRILGVMAWAAKDQIPFLEKCGVKFLRRNGNLNVMQQPGHSHPRHVCGENKTGGDFTLAMRRHARKIGIRFAERVYITKILSSQGRIAGAVGIDDDGSFLAFVSKCLILATGGFSQIYLNTTNAPGTTGDGQMLAFEQGVPLKDIEFIQFYPTAFGRRASQVLVYESFVSAGAVLRNSNGHNIIARHGLSDPIIMTRDRLSRAIMGEILDGRNVDHGVIMDLGMIPREQFTELRPLLPSSTPSMKKEFVVSPTAHFCMGGILIDENCETCVPGLFAVGEICAGAHGANRLTGNALAEVFSMGGIAGRRAASKAREIRQPEYPQKQVSSERSRLESLASAGNQDLSHLRRSLKQVMWYKAGILRTKKELEEALEVVSEIKSSLPKVDVNNVRQVMKSLELSNMLNISEIVCRAALFRTESRGSHYRNDFPDEDNRNWLKNIIIQKHESELKFNAVPVPMRTVTPP